MRIVRHWSRSQMMWNLHALRYSKSDLSKLL